MKDKEITPLPQAAENDNSQTASPVKDTPKSSVDMSTAAVAADDRMSPTTGEAEEEIVEERWIRVEKRGKQRKERRESTLEKDERDGRRNKVNGGVAEENYAQRTGQLRPSAIFTANMASSSAFITLCLAWTS